MKIIDPHLHLFALAKGDYHWLKPENPPFWPDKARINKAYTEQDLALQPSLTLAGFVHIEAGFDNQQPWRELSYLEQTCNKPFRAIAAIDFTLSSQQFNECLNELALLTSFIGVRHILDEQALSLLSNQQVLANFNTFNELANQRNETLVFEAQLPLTEHAPANALCEVISDNTNIAFIINHAGFPPGNIETIEWQRWQSNLLKLSGYPHVAIKCSGWEMINRDYKQDWLTQNLVLIFNTFGKDRMMLASNFPLCLFSHNNYQDYWQSIISNEFITTLSTQEKSALCYDNALRWYAINC
ncbi:amidohydrolase family protein [Colwellia sp. 20A7]|uniref:amidohydrolase family protein n=1 Tax=Colwellia sp. 20A7 TaxID=2689569 RepID=UPI001357BC0A|nr:amidohydrolase family protein [Colwellia sp. 20A7]